MVVSWCNVKYSGVRWARPRARERHGQPRDLASDKALPTVIVPSYTNVLD